MGAIKFTFGPKAPVEVRYKYREPNSDLELPAVFINGKLFATGNVPVKDILHKIKEHNINPYDDDDI
ncbi:MAG: hypothetical protein H0Z39_10660 [Peptococcaceae bacterium]|nr:hypothetical protein [Peptococcaceae bacterium]